MEALPSAWILDVTPARAVQVLIQELYKVEAPYSAMIFALRSLEKMSEGSLSAGENDGQPVGQVEVREGIAGFFV